MEKLLFTPGPLTTSETVKEAMLTDYGSRDAKFIELVKDIRKRILQLGGVSQEQGYEAILMQGSGTFGIEAVISSVIPEKGHAVFVINGAYGRRMAAMAGYHKIKTTELHFPENETPDLTKIETLLKREDSITHVAAVHCETTTGILNPVKEIGEIVKSHGKTYIVDAMSSFGAIPLNVAEYNIDYLISSANKCVEGVPGFSFIIANRENLETAKSKARTLSLDLYAQWQGLEKNGQFRFTPPTHTLAAFHQALIELEQEGGVKARAERYKKNHQTLVEGMRQLGFREYLDPEKQSHIITSFHYPEHANFDFAAFYQKLNEQGFVIYPGKVSQAACFRIGNIGKIYPNDIKSLVETIKVVIGEMGVVL